MSKIYDVNTNLSKYFYVNNIQVEYGKIPSGLVEGFEGIVFYFKTTKAHDADKHESAIEPLLNELEGKEYGFGAYWELKKIEAVIWEEHNQVTVASFRIRDSY